MYVLATAGHVDHGKSMLVRALTGMEPDRWAEERRRGMTIDLGYAWLSLPSGAELAFVDVPGHQRFIANMLAGLGPAPAVLFVVAADAGWSRQSEEHLAAVHALDVRHGVLAVTRSDLADPAPAAAQARERIARSSLGAVDTVAVSALTGAGLDDLRGALDRLVATLPTPDPSARVRLWIDRCFTVRGAGTVVTATLAAGTLRVADSLQLGDGLVTVRGLQTTGTPQDNVSAVARVALNLRGIAREDLSRGDVLLTPDAWPVTSTVDVRLDRADTLPAELTLHLGTAAVPVRIRPLGPALARLTLAAALPLQAGDRAVLRDPGRQSVAAGVLVLDADPPALRRRGAATARAAGLATAGGRPDAGVEVARRGAVRRADLARLGIAADAPVPDSLEWGPWVVSAATWRQWVAAAPVALDEWRAGNPLDVGAPPAAVRRAVGMPDDPALLTGVLAEAGLTLKDGRVTRAGTTADLGAVPGIDELTARLTTAPFAAPERSELVALRLGRRELAAAERAGRLLRVSPDIVLLPSAPQEAVALLGTLPQPFTASEARQALRTTRRVALPLLEYLDAAGRTERVDAGRRRLLG